MNCETVYFLSNGSSSAHEQSIGVAEIAKAVQLLDSTTQNSAAIASQNSIKSEELSRQSRKLGQLVSVIQGLVSGSVSKEKFEMDDAA